MAFIFVSDETTEHQYKTAPIVDIACLPSPELMILVGLLVQKYL